MSTDGQEGTTSHKCTMRDGCWVDRQTLISLDCSSIVNHEVELSDSV